MRMRRKLKNLEIIRTRDPSLLDQLDIIVDVGGVYDPAKNRFDHHQQSFTGTLDDGYSMKLSSAGLIYKHFGKEVIRSRLGTAEDNIINLIYYKVYKYFIEAIDGIDNGVDQYPKDVTPKYLIHTDLSARVGNLNPLWNEIVRNDDERFKQAVKLAGTEFMACVDYFGKAWLPARSIVERAVDSRYSIDPSGQIILLDQFCPWKDHLFDIEQEKKLQPQIIYVLFQDTNKTWRVQCVSQSEGSFENRVSLLWKGLRDQELSNASGIEGGIFVHATGFIGGNKTKEGALQMAQKSLTQIH